MCTDNAPESCTRTIVVAKSPLQSIVTAIELVMCPRIVVLTPSESLSGTVKSFAVYVEYYNISKMST